MCFVSSFHCIDAVLDVDAVTMLDCMVGAVGLDGFRRDVLKTTA